MKKKWVLDRDTISYGGALNLREMHISGKILLGHDKPINDPIKLVERENRNRMYM